MIIYEGIFFDEESTDLIRSLEKEKLPLSYSKLHCTFKFHPRGEEVFDEIAGEELELLLTGYGCDGRNSGFSIELPDYIKEYYINYDENGSLKVPHITTSLAKDAKAVDTKNLSFEPFAEPYVIKGRFGYYIGGNTNAFVSYIPQNGMYRSRKRK